MPRASVTFRPSPAAAEWLDQQRRERRIPLTTLCQTALDEHIRRHEARIRAEERQAIAELEMAAADLRAAAAARSIEPERLGG
jgi:hypothetical protein